MNGVETSTSRASGPTWRTLKLASACVCRAQADAHRLDAQVSRLRAEESRLEAEYYRASSPKLAELALASVATCLERAELYERHARDYEQLAAREEQRATEGHA